MFEYAISRNQRRRPTRRIYASWIASCLAHFLMLVLLIEFPQLLRGGMYHHFRGAALLANIMGPRLDDEDKDWRTVAILKNPSSMSAPSAATLKKYLYDWSKEGPQTPPVRIRWGDVPATLLDNMPPMPRVRKGDKKPELSLPANDIASADSAAAASGQLQNGQSGNASEIDSPAGRGTIGLPPPTPAPKSEIASNNPPDKIPDSIKPPPIASAGQKNQNGPNAVRVFEDEQRAIRSSESGFFDTKGFPLGEYADLIIERIKGKWFIPSNLRNSQGHTTVVFFIDRDGRFTNARIVASSGSNSLDLAALNAVIESDPFPPLPKGFPGNHVGAKFVFSYNEPP